MFRKYLVLALFVFVSGNPLLLTAMNQTPEQPKPQLKAGDLKIDEVEFESTTHQKVMAEWGTLQVSEKRDKPNGKLIALAFVRFKSTGRNPGPPIIYLEGGPGVSGINSAFGWMFPVFMAMRDAGDVIVLDQRGTGQTKPSLACPGTMSTTIGIDLSYEGMMKANVQDSRACVDALTSKGIDLTAYNTEESAADIEDLRIALGAPKINIFSFSYGTHLALAVIRKYEKNINRAILAGSAGPNGLMKLPSDLQKQLVAIDTLVKKDPKISKLVPDFVGLVKDVLDQFEKRPVTIEVADPKTKQKYSITVGKFFLQFYTAAFIGRLNYIKTMPIFYYLLSKGDNSALTELMQGLLRRPALPAVQYTMRCASGVSEDRYKRILKEGKETLLGNAVNFPEPEICSVWGTRDLGATFRSSVKSNVPALFISGNLDVNAPVTSTEEIRKGFPNSAHLIVENAGHEDLFINSPKELEAMLAFLKDGKFPPEKIILPALEFVIGK